MNLNECPLSTVVIDWRGRTIVYRRNETTTVMVRFLPSERNSADLFRYCCAIGVAQAHHVSHGCRTKWRGADSVFLDMVSSEFGWKLSRRSRETYWSTLVRGKRVGTDAAIITVVGGSGNEEPGQALELFGQAKGFVLGIATELGDSWFELWSVKFVNPNDDYHNFRDRVLSLLFPLSAPYEETHKQGNTDDDSGRCLYSATETPIARPSPPGNVPPLPRLFVGRKDVLTEMKRHLGIGEKAGRGCSIVTVVRGWPGIGKSTAAIVLAYEPEISRVFSDGVLWTSLGERPELMSELANWGRILGNDSILSAGSPNQPVEKGLLTRMVI